MISRVVFSVTYDCPISCKYCVTESGPWNGPALDAPFMSRVIDQALELGSLIVVVFTGGEPLLKLRDVMETIRYAQQHRLWTRIVTNSFWAATPDIALQILGDLKQAGLSEINLSCDDLHQEHIPLERVRNAYLAARELELPILIAHKRVKNGQITPESISDFFGVKLSEFKEGGVNQKTDLYSSSLTIPVGHGAKTLNLDDHIIYPTSLSAYSSPCSSILSSIIVSPAKDVRICCGMIDQRVPELTIGSLESQTLAEIVCEGNADLIANWLALEGPYGIMRFIREKAPEINFQDQYVNHCHLCNDIFTRDDVRKAIKQHAHEKVEAISLQRGFLEALRFKDEVAEIRE
jgi:hypothetical protein